MNLARPEDDRRRKNAANPDAAAVPSVVLVIGTLGGGGAERQLSDMANYWAARGWSVTLATWSGPELRDFYPLHAAVRRVHLQVKSANATILRRLRSNVARVVKLRKLLETMKPDALLSFVTESNLLCILASLGLGCRVVVSERIHPALYTSVPLAWRTLRKLLYVLAGDVVAQTNDAARWLKSHCHTSVSVVPNALRPLPVPAEERERLIVAVGRLTRQKGFDLLLQAFALVAERFADWRVVIIGEGVERENLALLCADLRLNNQVEFIGPVAGVTTWMARAGLLVQPSRFEGFPNVVLEGMGMCAAVISADCRSGPSEMIEDGVNGRLVPVEDVEALAKVMAVLMSQPEERERLGRAASAVRERYRQDIVMRQWERCLLPNHAETRPCAG